MVLQLLPLPRIFFDFQHHLVLCPEIWPVPAMSCSVYPPDITAVSKRLPSFLCMMPGPVLVVGW